MKIEQLKKGDLFRFPNGKSTYVFNGFCRSNRKYEYYRADDINAFGYKRKGTLIEVDLLDEEDFDNSPFESYDEEAENNGGYSSQS